MAKCRISNSWPHFDYCVRTIKLRKFGRVKFVHAGSTHSYIIDDQGKVFVLGYWGRDDIDMPVKAKLVLSSYPVGINARSKI